MGFIRDFINRKENEIINDSNISVKTLNKNWNSFLKQDTYLIYDDKSRFLHLIKKGNKDTRVPWYLFWHFKLKSKLRFNLEKLNEYGEIISIYNQNFVIQKKQEYRNLFKKGNLVLDDDQQTAIITDDKHNLVVAGAGSGKTEVLITRVAYLIKRKSDTIKPERILALAFQNKAAQEVKERLKKRYNINAIVPKEIYDEQDKTPLFSKMGQVTAGTFHSLGYKIIKDAAKIKGETSLKLKNECSIEWKYQNYIKKLYHRVFSNNKQIKNEIIKFMKAFGDKEKPYIKGNKESYHKYLRELEYTALNGKPVDSKAEKTIMDFFLSHKLNGEEIQIKHAEEAEWMKYKNESGEEVPPKPDFYFKDDEFELYWEHWALDKKGNVPPWFREFEDKNYIEGMKKKRNKFRSQDEYLFVETYSWEALRDDFIELIKERFLEALNKKFPNKKFELTPIKYEELIQKSWDSSKFIEKLPSNIARFIQIAKTNDLYPQDIKNRTSNGRWSSEQISFAKIANFIYESYQKELDSENKIDFSDMINKAVQFLKENKNLYKNTYEHILVDEYQDISPQRYELIKELMTKNPKCKLFCVGDDWQSIMGFSGSDLNYFINFDTYFHLGNHARTDLTKNYRSIKTIVDAGACIIKNNKGTQIEKKTVSNSDESKPLMLYSIHEKAFANKYNEKIAEHCLKKIKEYHEKGYAYDDFLVLMRITNEKKKIWEYIDKWHIELNIPIIKESHITKPNHVRFMSVHKSKGLQAKVMFILNLEKGLYGFPCELENPDIFEPAIRNNDGMKEREQEERRLFYVAVTRAKEEVIMYTQKCSESEFITEIKDFTKREELGY